MKTIKTIIICSIAVFTVSCKEYIRTNYCTTPENIWKLEKDMSLAQINATLGVEPNDVFLNDQSHSKVLVYKYRLRTQLTDSDDENQLRNYNEYFVKRDEKDLYVVLDSKTNKLVHYMTETGRQNADDVQKRAVYFKYILPEKIQRKK